MYGTPNLPYDEEKNIFLKNQVDAVLKGLELLSKNQSSKKFRIEEIVDRLADAEDKAQFQCGFRLLSQDKDVVEEIRQFMESRGYLTTKDSNYIVLTPLGLDRTKNAAPVPPEIEQYLN